VQRPNLKAAQAGSEHENVAFENSAFFFTRVEQQHGSEKDSEKRFSFAPKSRRASISVICLMDVELSS
jgi:hypothetical protein